MSLVRSMMSSERGRLREVTTFRQVWWTAVPSGRRGRRRLERAGELRAGADPELAVGVARGGARPSCASPTGSRRSRGCSGPWRRSSATRRSLGVSDAGPDRAVRRGRAPVAASSSRRVAREQERLLAVGELQRLAQGSRASARRPARRRAPPRSCSAQACSRPSGEAASASARPTGARGPPRRRRPGRACAASRRAPRRCPRPGDRLGLLEQLERGRDLAAAGELAGQAQAGAGDHGRVPAALVEEADGRRASASASAWRSWRDRTSAREEIAKAPETVSAMARRRARRRSRRPRRGDRAPRGARPPPRRTPRW
jgi:hypothetical protein